MSDPWLTAFPRLGASAAQSPFVIAFERAGVKGLQCAARHIGQSLMCPFSLVLPSIVNAVLIIVTFSAANTFIFSASRILYGLSVQGKAPRIFTTYVVDGLPWAAVIFSVCCPCQGFSTGRIYLSIFPVALLIFGILERISIIGDCLQVWFIL